MRLLLDTHVLLWWLDGSAQLGAVARARVAEPAADVHVSAVSGYEIDFKRTVGKLEAPADLDDHVRSESFATLAVTWRHAAVAGELPVHHRDPFDRVLVAQARCEGLTLVTADRELAAYDVPILDATR